MALLKYDSQNNIEDFLKASLKNCIVFWVRYVCFEYV